MKKLLLLAVLLLGLMALVGGGPVRAMVPAKPTAPPTPTPPPPPTNTPTPTNTPLPPTPTTKPPPPPTPTPVPPTPVPPTNTPVPPTNTPRPRPTSPPPPTATATAVPTAAPTQQGSGAPIQAATAVPTPTSALTVTATFTPTATTTPTPTPTVTVAWGGEQQQESDGLLAQTEEWVAALPPWALPVGGALLVGLAAGLAWLVTRFVHYTGRDLQMKQRMIAESEMTRLEERRREVEALLVAQDAWLRVVSQTAADTLKRPVQIDPDVPPRVSGKPAPYFTVTDKEGTRYVFTTDVRALQTVGLLRKRVRPLPLPSPVEAGLVWQHLAEKFLRGANEVIPAVPRTATWSLVVVKER